MERSQPPDEPIRKIELGIERPEFEALLAQRQRLGGFFDEQEPQRGWIAMFEMLLESLPQTDPELAVAAYEALAVQGNSDLRGNIAVRIDLLFPVDREATMRIAAHLICSDDVQLGKFAMESFMNAIEDGRVGVEDVAPLADLYLEVRERREAEQKPDED